MRIAIPIDASGVFNAHFGQSKAFEVFDVEDNQIRQSWRVEVPAHGGCGAIPAILAREGVLKVLAGSMGAGAMANLKRFQIEPLPGASGTDPRQMLTSFLAGSLPLTGAACEGHHHGHGHHHHHGKHGHAHDHGHHQHRHGQCCHTEPAEEK